MKHFKATLSSGLSLGLSFSIATAPLAARATEPMDQARETVDALMMQANSLASQAITGDFNYAISQVMTIIATGPEAASLMANLAEKQTGLLAQMNQISTLSPDQVAQVTQNAFAAFERYKDFTREKFDLSFQAATIRERERDSLRVAVAALKQFNANCSSGKGIGGLGETAFKYPDLPTPDVGFSIGTNGFDVHTSGTGSQGEQNRSTAVNMSGTIAGSVAAVAYLPAAITGASASTVAVCAAAAPYTLGAGIAVAAVMAYINVQERLKMESEISQAKTYAFDHMANDKDIARFYRQQCQDMSVRTKPLIDVLSAAIQSPQSLEDFAGTEDFVAEMDQLSAIAKRRGKLAENLKALATKKDEASVKAANDLANQLMDLEKQIAKISTPEHVAKMAVQILIGQREELSKAAAEHLTTALDLAQKRAFQTILKIMNLVQQHEFSKFLNGSDEIAREIAASKEFTAARLMFKQTLAIQIKAIFGHATPSELATIQKQLVMKTKTLIAAYPSSKDVKGFMLQVSQLLGGL